MITENEQQYLKKLIAAAKEKIKEQYGVEIKNVLKIDTAKSMEDNKKAIIDTLKIEKESIVARLREKKKNEITSLKDEKRKSEIEKVNAENERIKRLKEEEEKTIRTWKEQFNPDMIIKSPAYFEMEKYIEMVCAGFCNFCVVVSQGGLAKTWTSQAILKRKNKDYAYLNSFTTPLELYNFLYDHRQNQIILIDDCEGIWNSKSIISILKNATELNGTRTISWNSTTDKLEGRTNTCEFSSRIILLTNEIPEIDDNPHLQALLSRAFLCKLNFSYREKIDIVKEVSKKEYQSLNDSERQEIFEFIERNTNEATNDLSIRTLIKCYQFYMFDKSIWKELALKILNTNPRKEIVLELMKSNRPVKEQEQIYFTRTGHSRADFFRIKQELIPKRAEYLKAA